MSGIIKAGHFQGRSTVQSAAFNFEDITTKANRYLDTVRGQAGQILEQAKKEALQIKQQAKVQGREEAVEEAKQQLKSELDQRLQTLLPALDEAVASIRHSRQAWLKHWERQTVHLASAIAARVVRRELRQVPEITLDLIREALALAVGNGRVRLHLNPQDHDTLREKIPALTAQISNLAPADIVADPEISQGGCRVVTEFGNVDQQIESQLARIEEDLL